MITVRFPAAVGVSAETPTMRLGILGRPGVQRLDQVVAGEIVIDAEPVPLAEVEKAWSQPDDGRRIVVVP